MTDAKLSGYMLTTGDRINKRLENFRNMVNDEIEGETISLEDFNKILIAIQRMVSHETADVLKRRGR